MVSATHPESTARPAMWHGQKDEAETSWPKEKPRYYISGLFGDRFSSVLCWILWNKPTRIIRAAAHIASCVPDTPVKYHASPRVAVHYPIAVNVACPFSAIVTGAASNFAARIRPRRAHWPAKNGVCKTGY